MLVHKERAISGPEVKKSTTIKSTRIELLGQFLLEPDRPFAMEEKKNDNFQGKGKRKRNSNRQS